MAWRAHMGEPPEPGEGIDPGRLWWRTDLVPHQYGGHADDSRWEYVHDYLLSQQYLNQWLGVRLPLSCWLPSGQDWLIDGLPTGGSRGWVMRGVPPNVTVDPGVYFVDTYFGILEHGWLSHDLYGRTYPELDPALDQDEPSFEMPA